MLFVNRIRFENFFTAPLLRTHLCTLAVALSFNNVIRLPREGIYYGTIPYLLALLIVSVLIGLPGALLQITLGQFQQDVISTWRAVPFFKGVGYLKLLTSFLACIYIIIFISLSIGYIIFGASGAMLFSECKEVIMMPTEYINNVTASTCFNETMMSPVSDKPHYYAITALVVLIIWIALSSLMFGCIRNTKRFFYFLGPVILILSLLTIIFMTNMNEAILQTSEQWRGILAPHLWYSAIIQMLMSTHICTGYLLTAGDTNFNETSAKWSAVIFIFINMISSWFYSLFWYAIEVNKDQEKHTFSILVIIYEAAQQRTGLNLVWPFLCLSMVFISGIVGVMTLFYPIYDQLKRIQGRRKWIAAIIICVFGILITLLVLGGRNIAINILDQKIVPLLIVFTTVLEAVAFAYIYGAELLTSDVEFVIDDKLSKYWKFGWYFTPPFITMIFIWWLYEIIIANDWDAWIILGTFSVAFVLFTIFAVISVSQQIHYDWFSKVKSSFKATDWGPMDPISRYYWLSRREEMQRGITAEESRPSRYSRNILGHLSGTPSVVRLNEIHRKSLEWPSFELGCKRRANSDDLVYTEHRKKAIGLDTLNTKSCSVSLDKDFKVPK